MCIAQNLKTIKQTLPETVTLVAVSKTKPVKDILEAYQEGQRIFGENKIQEMTQKWEEMPKDIEWHMIGHVQRNKVKYMAPYVTLIHGVDSLKLLTEINKQAIKNNRIISCLLQVHVAEEDTKFGFDEGEIGTMIVSPAFQQLKNITVKGIMGMATFTTNQDQIRREFKQLKRIYDHLSTKLSTVNVLSMGMSSDYKIAIAEGSNMVRIGSSIFGNRTYP